MFYFQRVEKDKGVIKYPQCSFANVSDLWTIFRTANKKIYINDYANTKVKNFIGRFKPQMKR